MKKAYGLDYISEAIAVVGTAIQTNEILQIISLVITVIAGCVSILFSILKFITWLKNAIADGKITSEELEDGSKHVQEIKDEVKDVKQHLDDKK